MGFGTSTKDFDVIKNNKLHFANFFIESETLFLDQITHSKIAQNLIKETSVVLLMCYAILKTHYMYLRGVSLMLLDHLLGDAGIIIV